MSAIKDREINTTFVHIKKIQNSSTLPFDGSLDIEGDSEGTEDGVNST